MSVEKIEKHREVVNIGKEQQTQMSFIISQVFALLQVSKTAGCAYFQMSQWKTQKTESTQRVCDSQSELWVHEQCNTFFDCWFYIFQSGVAGAAIAIF